MTRRYVSYVNSLGERVKEYWLYKRLGKQQDPHIEDPKRLGDLMEEMDIGSVALYYIVKEFYSFLNAKTNFK